MMCEVDLETMVIRFDCEDQAAQRAAVANRIAQLTRLLNARSGWTNRQRQTLARERNILQRRLNPKTPGQLWLDRLAARKLKGDTKAGRVFPATEREWKAYRRRLKRRIEKRRRIFQCQLGVIPS